MTKRVDSVRNLREDMDHLPGQVAAQRRMVKHSYAIFPAFDSLDLGFKHDAAIEYLKPVFDALAVPEEKRARFAGGVLAFGMTCVEADRAQRQRTLDDFDAWLSFRPEFAEALAAFRSAFGTNTGVGRMAMTS